MEFDKSRVYTSLNADELKVGSQVFVANSLEMLRRHVAESEITDRLYNIQDEENPYRFMLSNGSCYNLAYFVSEPEEKKLKWTDLKIGDVIKKKDSEICYLVTGMDYKEDAISHVHIANLWIDDDCLDTWEKVEVKK